MDETIVNTPESEVIDQAETTVEEVPQEQTQQTIEGMEEDSQPVRQVGFQELFVLEKKSRAKVERELAALKQSIENGASQGEINSDIDAIADKYDVDKDFLEDLSSTIKKGFEDELSAKQLVEQRAKKFEKAFENAYSEALDRGPEFKTIANADVIKQLALLPQNAKKTLSQILEDTYGNALTGKRTIETTKPGGGKDPEPLDFNRASKDTSYFLEVMADPKKKAQYNEAMLKKGF